MLIAEDLLLLLVDDVTGRVGADTTRLDVALAGAVLLELATAGRVAVEDEGPHAGRLVVRDASPTGDTVLDDALGRIAGRSRPARPKDALSTLAKGLRPALLERLVGQGIVRAEQGRILGVFPVHRWPAVDSAHEDATRRGLHDVMTGRAPTQREAALVSLLHALDQVPKVLAQEGVDKRRLKARAKEVADAGFAGEAVRQAIEAIDAAMVAVIAATTAAGATG